MGGKQDIGPERFTIIREPVERKKTMGAKNGSFIKGTPTTLAW